MANQLRQQIEQISREKNINPDVIIAAIEDAILTASKKYYKEDEDLRSRFNEETGLIEVFAVKQVVEEVEIPETQLTLEEAHGIFPGAEISIGQEIEFPKPTDVLGRIAAQTAKQVIFQKVREAERDNVYAEYSDRVGEVVNGIVKRQEMGDFIVDLGRAEAILPRKEQSPGRGLLRPGIGSAWPSCGSRRRRKGPQVIVSPHRSRAPRQAVRDGGARDLRRDRPDPGRGARGRASAPRSRSSRASTTSIRSGPAWG